MSSQWSDSAIAGDTTAATAAEAKQNLARCEQEIATIKTALRNLGQPSDDDDTNTLTIKWVKIEGLPETAVPKLTLQLSSPVETAELTNVLMEANVPKSDDVTSAESNEGKTKESTTKSEAATTLGEQTDDEESDGVQVDVSSDVVTDVDSAIDSESKTTIPPNNEGSVITFRGVETGQATLSVEAMDADIPLGSSAAYDLAPYTSQLLNAMDRDSNVYTMDMQVAILPSGGGSGTQDDTTLAPEAVCTVTLRLEYCPSPKDKREELYELLDKAGEKKSAAVEMLRQAAMAAARTRSSATDQTGVVSKPAVKPGFLNKKEKPKEISSVVAFYERNLGPNSPLRRLLPVAKNYILFFGFIALSHFKGQFLGLPKPV